MNFRAVFRLIALLLALPLGGLLAAKEKARDETLILFEQRRVAIAVPEGFVFTSNKDEQGFITARLNDPKDKVSLQISFLPDSEGEYATARGRKELMVKSFQQLVSGSVEQAMQFEELEPRSGAGTYCIFTDSALVGKTKYPPGEYLNSTAGIKSWRGCFVVFTLLSNDTKSDEYRAAMKVLRDSLAELPLTPLR
ncbi:MAG: hypothetical protein NTV51_08305 [Verrucomicrobia bacterium]|nr:hypothetical protein [Verrucomicrobiota bacterium]